MKSAFDSSVSATTGSHANATLSETVPEIQSSDLCSNLQAGGIADISWDSNGRAADYQRVENQDLLESTNGRASVVAASNADQLIEEIRKNGLKHEI